MTNFTPGPWGIVKDKRNINYGDIESCYNGALVCIMPEIDSGLEDELISEADARLIAAAPEMHKALERSLGYIGALAKAHNELPFLKNFAEETSALLLRIEGVDDE